MAASVLMYFTVGGKLQNQINHKYQWLGEFKITEAIDILQTNNKHPPLTYVLIKNLAVSLIFEEFLKRK
jgi:hypothetical protein